ncbi:MAG: fluoride efflux transporter CrcB [Bacteroidetes bacterium]|nr:fluoride efflux transporter CrcB [Bacteroidota bacterium]
MKNILLVGLGGGLGSIARYLCQKMLAWYAHSFPTGTFLVNILGCFLIGLFYALAEKQNFLNPEWRLLLMTGFCGGYTTFSTFALENIMLYRNGEFLYLGLYITGSVLLGIAATFCGMFILKLF